MSNEVDNLRAALSRAVSMIFEDHKDSGWNSITVPDELVALCALAWGDDSTWSIKLYPEFNWSAPVNIKTEVFTVTQYKEEENV